MCECNSNPCCCERVISVRGKKGDKGNDGPPGPPGIATGAHRKSIAPLDYIASGWTNILSFTITEPGNYIIMADATVYPTVSTSETLNFEIRKGGVAISGAQDQIKYNVPNPNETKKAAINTAVNGLVAGDVINFAMQSGKDMVVGHRTLTLIKVVSLNIA